MVTIQEKRELVNQTRETNRTVQVYDYADLSGVGINLPSSQRVKLTGIVGDGLAQIKEPVIGWVNATYLKTPTETRKGARYRVRMTSAPNGLRAYWEPGKAQNDGPAGGATVFLTEPQDSYVEGGRKFVRVFYTGKANNERIGYVSQGPIGSNLGQPNSNFEGPL
ncbi:MAG: hypothetical protein OHK0037_25640 [Elainellaceae cyanobacterium]